MKQKNQKKSNKKLTTQKILIILFISMKYTSAPTNNYKVYTQIYSNYHNINMITNTLTITGNILIQNNNFNIHADKVIITYLDKKNKEKKIDAYGVPVIFYQSKNNKKKILATSLHMSYNTLSNTMILKGQAFFKKENYTLKSDCIKYITKNKSIETCNDQNQKIQTTVIIDIYKNNK